MQITWNNKKTNNDFWMKHVYFVFKLSCMHQQCLPFDLPVAALVFRVPQVSCSTWMCQWERRLQPSAPRLAGSTWCARTLTMPSSTWDITTAQSACGRPTRKRPSLRCSATRVVCAPSLSISRARKSPWSSHMGQVWWHVCFRGRNLWVPFCLTYTETVSQNAAIYF